MFCDAVKGLLRTYTHVKQADVISFDQNRSDKSISSIIHVEIAVIYRDECTDWSFNMQIKERNLSLSLCPLFSLSLPLYAPFSLSLPPVLSPSLPLYSPPLCLQAITQLRHHKSRITLPPYLLMHRRAAVVCAAVCAIIIIGIAERYRRLLLLTPLLMKKLKGAGLTQKNQPIYSVSSQGAYSLFPKPTHFLLEAMIKLSNSSLFQRRTVRDLLWGYTDPMLNRTVGLFAPVSKLTPRRCSSNANTEGDAALTLYISVRFPTVQRHLRRPLQRPHR